MIQKVLDLFNVTAVKIFLFISARFKVTATVHFKMVKKLNSSWLKVKKVFKLKKLPKSNKLNQKGVEVLFLTFFQTKLIQLTWFLLFLIAND